MIFSKFKIKNSSGMSLVEVIIASAILLLFFGGLISGVRLMIDLIGQSKAETGARSLALSRMEYLRSLNYDNLGTEGGIPAGNISQSATSSLNGIQYTERLLILYVDRPEDGLEEFDENGVLEDSKRVKVEYSWQWRSETKSLSLITDIAPKGQETSAGGGTLVVKVFDSVVAPLSGVSVNVVNNSLDPVIDLTVTSNSDGKAIFPGAPAGGNYEITVTGNDYSTDGTYSVTTENPNPNPPHVAVASSTITTMTFFVDRLSDLTFRTIGEPVVYNFTDEFTDGTLLVGESNIAVVLGQLVLDTDEFGAYLGNGQTYATTTAPTPITSWQSIDWNMVTPANTSALVRLYSESGGSWSLVSDTDLSGNSSGFIAGPIDISTLATTTYSRLALGAELSTTEASSTPALDDWQISYVENEPALAGITLHASSTKQIGSGVLKYYGSITTDSVGIKTVELEWDTYNIAIDGVTEGYDIKEVRGILPYIMSPNITDTLTFVLVPHTSRTLHITVTDTNNNPQIGASVQLTATGYNETLETSIYGQVFFTGLSTNDYTISITKSGYSGHTDVTTVDGNVMYRVNMISL